MAATPSAATKRIDALEEGMATLTAGMTALRADDHAAAFRRTKATPAGWKATAEVMPESVKRERQQSDPNARCSLQQVQYAAHVASAFQGLTQRQTDGVTWYAGVKRESDDSKAEQKRQAEYAAHMEDAIVAMCNAFNVFSPDVTLNPDTATYGELWDWLNSHAPVSYQKAKREHDAELKRRMGGNGK